MEEFELVATQIMNQLSYGRSEEEIALNLIQQGCSPGVAEKVLRLAKFRLRHLKKAITP